MRVNFGAGRSLARTRARAGVSARAKYLRTTKSSRSSVSSRLSSVRRNATTNATSKNKSGSSVKADIYSDVELAAKNLQKDLSSLMQTGDKSLFSKQSDSKETENVEQKDKSKENASKKETSYVGVISSFAKHYNEMIDGMADIGDTTSIVYAANLKSDMSAQSKALGKIGVTLNKDGSLKVDEKALKDADAASVEKLFGSKGSISSKAVKYAASVEKYAASRLKTLNATNYASLSSGYNRYGNSVNNYYNSRYNYRS